MSQKISLKRWLLTGFAAAALAGSALPVAAGPLNDDDRVGDPEVIKDDRQFPVPVEMAPTGDRADTAAWANMGYDDDGAVHRTITNGPVPDTPSARDEYGGPMSNAGEETAPVGN